MRDAEHLGSPADSTSGLTEAGALIDELVDSTTGNARERTVPGNGAAPFRLINGLGNILHGCAATGGGSAGDGSPCGRLFSISGGSQTADTLRAALFLSHNAADRSLTALASLVTDDEPFQPVPDSPPAVWTLNVIYRLDAIGLSPSSLAQYSWIDAAGNKWTIDRAGNTANELIGASRPDTSSAMQSGKP